MCRLFHSTMKKLRLNFIHFVESSTVCEINVFVGKILNLIPDNAFLPKYLLLY